jgi:hypothetical protein
MARDGNALDHCCPAISRRSLVVSAKQMVVYVLKGHDFSRAANDLG